MSPQWILPLFCVGILHLPCYGQAVRAQPYNGQLRTDPAVGNVQGIQRYGRPLKTDPDMGEGYSYHVYPVANDPNLIVVGGTQGGGRNMGGQTATTGASIAGHIASLEAQRLRVQEQLALAVKENRPKKEVIDPLTTLASNLQKDIDAAQAQQRSFSAAPGSASVDGAFASPGSAVAAVSFLSPWGGSASPIPPPFDATEGIRNVMQGPPGAAGLHQYPGSAGFGPASFGPGGFGPAALAVGAAGDGLGLKAGEIYHQPLIQVKVRVIEVVRTNDLAVSSVLDYISNMGDPSRITFNNINNNRQRTTGVTRFAPPSSLIGVAGTMLNTGSGLLVNITGEHLNFIASLLATEFNGDIITAPEVVTLNGQNVEFIAGSKVPFQLGQNVIQGTNNNIQQFFYKHVGSYISVTPKIVNWGFHGEGRGEAPIVAADVWNWHQLIRWMMEDQKDSWEYPVVNVGTAAAPKWEAHKLLNKDTVPTYINEGLAVPIEVKTWVLNQLKRFAKSELLAKVNKAGMPAVLNPDCTPGCGGCDWNPQDCTIDLAVVVRLSQPGMQNITAQRTDTGATVMIPTTTEDNVRAIANIIQVKSGHGVVMAGLIGEREAEDVSKVPVLGDIPVVGALFRSKLTSRQKTELVLLIEAQVLDPRPEAARCQSGANFRLAQPFLGGDLLDNPLEFGLYRAGMGTYLPPHSKEEQIYWERLGRKVRRICTTVDDIFK